MGLQILAEAVLRVEHKIDALLEFFQIKTKPMHFLGASCPACNKAIDYFVDVQHQIVTRRCDCRTGKVVSSFPLLPAPGARNVGSSEDRSQREAR